MSANADDQYENLRIQINITEDESSCHCSSSISTAINNAKEAAAALQESSSDCNECNCLNKVVYPSKFRKDQIDPETKTRNQRNAVCGVGTCSALGQASAKAVQIPSQIEKPGKKPSRFEEGCTKETCSVFTTTNPEEGCNTGTSRLEEGCNTETCPALTTSNTEGGCAVETCAFRAKTTKAAQIPSSFGPKMPSKEGCDASTCPNLNEGNALKSCNNTTCPANKECDTCPNKPKQLTALEKFKLERIERAHAYLKKPLSKFANKRPDTVYQVCQCSSTATGKPPRKIALGPDDICAPCICPTCSKDVCIADKTAPSNYVSAVSSFAKDEIQRTRSTELKERLEEINKRKDVSVCKPCECPGGGCNDPCANEREKNKEKEEDKKKAEDKEKQKTSNKQDEDKKKPKDKEKQKEKPCDICTEEKTCSNPVCIEAQQTSNKQDENKKKTKDKEKQKEKPCDICTEEKTCSNPVCIEAQQTSNKQDEDKKKPKDKEKQKEKPCDICTEEKTCSIPVCIEAQQTNNKQDEVAAMCPLTKSELREAIDCLMEKAKAKDAILNTLGNELVKIGDPKMVDNTLKGVILGQKPEIDYDKYMIAKDLIGTASKGTFNIFGVDAGKDCACKTLETTGKYSNNVKDASLQILKIKKTGPTSLLVKWTPSKNPLVKGYEIFVNGESKFRILEPNKVVAVVNYVNCNVNLKVTVQELSDNICCRCLASATEEYRPEMGCINKQ